VLLGHAPATRAHVVLEHSAEHGVRLAAGNSNFSTMLLIFWPTM
jgi:hypothetical protein